jgi:hypothetical protein
MPLSGKMSALAGGEMPLSDERLTKDAGETHSSEAAERIEAECAFGGVRL